jgi:hypothetical protein
MVRAGARWAVATAVLLGGWVTTGAAAAGPVDAEPTAQRTSTLKADFRGQAVSDAARAVAQWSLASGDNTGRPFAVVDKKDARLYVFTSSGRLVGATAALLGLARGDDGVPGVGRKVASGIPRHERTTPAGRFESEPGHNLSGEAVVWFDYEAALAIHRIRPAAASERRPQRLASETAADNRISLGCVVVDEAFYDQVVAPTMGKRRGVVYVLPETRDWRVQFGIGNVGAEAL